MASNGSTGSISAPVKASESAKRTHHVVVGPPEGGWGWVVAGGTCLISMMLSIPGMAFGILLNDTLLEFNTTTATASWTIAISFGSSSFISPLVTMGISSSSCRVIAFIGGLLLGLGMMLSYFAHHIHSLFLTQGFLIGLGYGCCRISTAVVLGEYFHQRYPTSTGLMMAGFSISRLLFSFAIQLINEQYGLRGTYLITGAICMNACVGASLFQPAKWHSIRKAIPDKEPAGSVEMATKTTKDPHISEGDVSKPSNNNVAADVESTETSTAKGTGKNRYIDMSLLRDKSFYTIVASTIPFQVVFIYSSIFLVPLGRDKGFQPMDAAMVQTYKAFGEVAGRIGIPWILALCDCEPMSAYLAMCLLNGLAFLVHAVCDGYAMFVATAILSAFLCGGIAIQGYHLTLVCVGPNKLSSAFGLSALFVGVFVLAAGPLLGYVRDVTGTLVNSFLIIAALQVITGLVWINRVLSLWKSKKALKQQSDINNHGMVAVQV